MRKIKQVIILRKDLNMRLGKAVAQGAHASMKVYFDRMHLFGFFSICFFTKVMVAWFKGSFAKIVVSCNSEEELIELQNRATSAGIVNAIILDEGRTEFKQTCPICGGTGELCLFDHKELDRDASCGKCGGTGKVSRPTYTALAIGPDYADKIDPLTKDLKLL